MAGLDQIRLQVSKGTDARKKAAFGQFLTPASTAAFMAGLFPTSDGTCRLLDAGAGIGSLAAAFLDRWSAGDFKFDHVHVDAFEIDESLHQLLAETLDKFASGRQFTATIHDVDFIHAAADSLAGSLFADTLPTYTHAILNPPYKKLRSDSPHRTALRRAGIETVNLYSAFLALSLGLLDEGGQLVAIVPRSFCNGPYYRPFREYVLKQAAIQHLHLFDSRNKAFKDDDVLQENIIIRLERGGRQGSVAVSTSTDDTFVDLKVIEHPFDSIVHPGDAELFFHVPTLSSGTGLETCPAIRHTLADLEISVSTGPVVDFRLKQHLSKMPSEKSVPLLYPGHFANGAMDWPKEGGKKPNAIERNSDTEKWLFPNGHYCVVRRFSAKEERRRVVANVINPDGLSNAAMIGIENHLNVFHEDKHGLPEPLAHGLAVFLNTTAVDEYFRCFSGHTQVNATDLKRMKYPSRESLTELGQWAMRNANVTQAMIDEQFAVADAPSHLIHFNGERFLGPYEEH